MNELYPKKWTQNEAKNGRIKKERVQNEKKEIYKRAKNGITKKSACKKSNKCRSIV